MFPRTAKASAAATLDPRSVATTDAQQTTEACAKHGAACPVLPPYVHALSKQFAAGEPSPAWSHESGKQLNAQYHVRHESCVVRSRVMNDRMVARA